MYTLRNREPGLLPFNSIHHRYYRADSQVLSFFFFIYNSSCFISTLCSPDPPHASYKGKALQVHNFIWCEDWPLQSFSCNQSHCKVFFVLFLYSCRIWYFFFFFFDRAANRIYIHLHSLQAPGSSFSFPDNRRDLTFRRRGITTVYCIKMYSGFYWHTFHRLNSCKIGGTPSIALH